jgi:hypothetical protein
VQADRSEYVSARAGTGPSQDASSASAPSERRQTTVRSAWALALQAGGLDHSPISQRYPHDVDTSPLSVEGGRSAVHDLSSVVVPSLRRHCTGRVRCAVFEHVLDQSDHSPDDQEKEQPASTSVSCLTGGCATVHSDASAAAPSARVQVLMRVCTALVEQVESGALQAPVRQAKVHPDRFSPVWLASGTGAPQRVGDTASPFDRRHCTSRFLIVLVEQALSHGCHSPIDQEWVQPA